MPLDPVVYCNRCSGINTEVYRVVAGVTYYKCLDCTAELGRNYLFRLFPAFTASAVEGPKTPDADPSVTS